MYTSNASLAHALITLALCDGGATFRKPNATGRYVVGSGAAGIIVLEDDPDAEAKVERFLDGISHTDRYDGVGSWKDNGEIYIDPVTVHDTDQEAVMTAIIRGEFALWDSVEETTIETGLRPGSTV